MAKKKRSYHETIQELESIVKSLEQGDLNIDELSANVKKATELLQYCKKALHTIEGEVNELMNDDEQ